MTHKTEDWHLHAIMCLWLAAYIPNLCLFVGQCAFEMLNPIYTGWVHSQSCPWTSVHQACTLHSMCVTQTMLSPIVSLLKTRLSLPVCEFCLQGKCVQSIEWCSLIEAWSMLTHTDTNTHIMCTLTCKLMQGEKKYHLQTWHNTQIGDCRDGCLLLNALDKPEKKKFFFFC